MIESTPCKDSLKQGAMHCCNATNGGGKSTERRQNVMKFKPSGDDAQEEFHCTSFDAKVWAKEFMRIYREQTQKDICLDEALMIGWFANAIMAGYDYAKRQSLLPKRLDEDDDCVSTCQEVALLRSQRLSKEEVLRQFDEKFAWLHERGVRPAFEDVKSWLSEILTPAKESRRQSQEIQDILNHIGEE